MVARQLLYFFFSFYEAHGFHILREFQVETEVDKKSTLMCPWMAIAWSKKYAIIIALIGICEAAKFLMR